MYTIDNIDELLDYFSNTTDKNKIKKVFEELLTGPEIEDLCKRWQILKDLYNGMPQRKIAQDMQVSLCKITRGSKILKQDNSEIKQILSDLFDETHI